MREREIASLGSLAMSFSAVLDMLSPRFANHHQRTAFIAYQMGLEMNLPIEYRQDLLLAGSFHDIGSVAPLSCLGASGRRQARAEVGYRLLREFEPFARAADLVRHQHLSWLETEGRPELRHSLGYLGSGVLHLADYVASHLPSQRRALDEARGIGREIEEGAGTRFHPRAAEAFLGLARKEAFWLDATSSNPVDSIKSVIDFDPVELDYDTLIDLGRLFSRIIDFRSHFTAAHSSGVSETAGVLAEYADFSLEEQLAMRLAGFLHDLGKLAVPASIIEKRGPLTPAEANVMRGHSYFGYRALQKTASLATVNAWGSLHHERLDGSGYPFRLTKVDLPLGARIMAVADVFAALSEERPYREGLRPKAAFAAVSAMADSGSLDRDIVGLMGSRLAEIADRREEAVALAIGQYKRFLDNVATEVSASRRRVMA